MSKVMKFGGGCLRDGRTFAQACAIIAGQRRVVVVVSAVSGVTELLLAAIDQARRGEKHIPAILERLAEKHLAVIAAARLAAAPRQAPAAGDRRPTGRRCARLLTGIAYHGDLTPAVRARLLSFGERMAARLLAGCWRAGDGKPGPWTPTRPASATDDNFENASIDRERTRNKLGALAAPLLRQGVVPVISGFFGRGPGGAVTLLGPQRLRLQRRRRGLRREGGAAGDLEGRRRLHERRPGPGGDGAPPGAHLVRRGGRAFLFRRPDPPPAHGGAAGRDEDPRVRAQHEGSRQPGQRDRRRPLGPQGGGGQHHRQHASWPSSASTAPASAPSRGCSPASARSWATPASTSTRC